MRVLFSSTFGYGHMFPMYPLARAFLAAGHDVLWATSADARDRLEAAGLPAAPCRPGRSGAPRTGRQPAGARGLGQPAGAGRLHVPPPVRRDADPADGGRPAPPRDALAARPDGPRARRAGVAAGRCGAAGPERDARLRRRDPAEHAGGRRRPTRRPVGRARAGPAAVRRQLHQPLPRHLSAVGPVGAVGPRPGAAAAASRGRHRRRHRATPRLPRAGRATARLRHPGHGPEPAAPVGPGRRAPSPGCPSGSSSPSVPTATRTLSDLSPTTSASSGGSTSRASCSTATWWSPTRARARSSAPSPRVCPSCACPRPPTSSATPRGPARAGVALVLLPDESSPETIASAVHALLTDTSVRQRAQAVADEIAAMPAPAEVVARLVTRL